MSFKKVSSVKEAFQTGSTLKRAFKQFNSRLSSNFKAPTKTIADTIPTYGSLQTQRTATTAQKIVAMKLLHEHQRYR
ncbi:hypothetical protein GTO27_09525 [Candidatus Bathyarchaeota archaeon]|nr:hypothetical protein [Candidatus Bathyarchaeota archaeon]